MSEVFGVIAPHPPIMVESVGGADSEVTSASAEALLEAAGLLRRFGPESVVIMSPHSPGAADAFVVDTAERYSGTLSQFGAPETHLTYPGDRELADRILAELDARGIAGLDKGAVASMNSGHLDHGVIVPMSFLDPAGTWPIVVLSLSWLPYADHEELGRAVAAAARALGRRIAFVASGDCSHRLKPGAPAGYSQRAAEFDALLVDRIADSDFEALSHIDPDLVDEAGECGLRSFITLGAAAAPAKARVLAYEGPWGVGYLTAVVNEGGVSKEASTNELVDLARRTIETYVNEGRTLAPPPLSTPDLPARAGAFVSLHRGGELRGCIGTIEPTESDLAHEVVRNAIQAAVCDPRFPPLEASELADLDVKVDVLHPTEGCEFADLDPKRYGVVVTCGHRRGLLLPDLEGVDTPEQQVTIACRKAGISPDEPIVLERFRVDRHT